MAGVLLCPPPSCKWLGIWCGVLMCGGGPFTLSCALRGKTPGLNQAVPERSGWSTSLGAQDSPGFAGNNLPTFRVHRDLTSFTEFTYKWCWLLWRGTPGVPPAFVLTSPEPCPQRWGHHSAACSRNYVYSLLCPSAAVVRGPVGAPTRSLLGSLCLVAQRLYFQLPQTFGGPRVSPHQPAHDFSSARVLGTETISPVSLALPFCSVLFLQLPIVALCLKQRGYYT